MQLAPGLLALVLPERAASPARTRPRRRVQPGLSGPTGAHAAAGTRTLHVYLSSLLSGAAISVAWWLPETVASALLGWVAASLLIFAIRARRAYLPAYCCGLVCCSLGFYWIGGT